jgi:hypothetical protein
LLDHVRSHRITCPRQVDRLIALSGEVRALRGLGPSQLRSLAMAARGCQCDQGGPPTPPHA